MPRYALKIEYDGARFVGWQRQQSQVSVQGSIEKHSSSTKSQHTSPLVGSGVLPPKTHQYPKTQTQTASASNKYETTR